LKPSRFFSVIPVISWLFIQLVMTGAWSTGAAAIGSSAYAGQAVVICTGNGLVTIYLDENGNPVEGEDGETQATPCDWCTSFSTAPTLTAPASLLDFTPCAASNVHFAAHTDSRSPQAVATNARIRAPPVRAMS